MYEATGQIVKAQAGYAAFCSLELQLFGEINGRPKASQPVRSVVELVRASVRAAPSFHVAMDAVVAGVNGARKVAVGGVVYKPAPLKKATRIVEKLLMDPVQQLLLTAPPPPPPPPPEARCAPPAVIRRRDAKAGTLDASGLLDTVRGMFVCSTMAHAVELLKRLAAHARAGVFELLRSKNRFAR